MSQHQHSFKNTCCDESASHFSTDSNQPIEHDHAHDVKLDVYSFGLIWWKPIVIALLLIGGFLISNFNVSLFQSQSVQLVFYICLYALIAWPILIEAWEGIRKGNWFSEFVLMLLATIGAFVIGEYAEAVAVMLFYTVGETLQSLAVRNAKHHIAQLIDKRPTNVTILKGEDWIEQPAAAVEIGTLLKLKVGEQLALDGILESDHAVMDTATLTGESLPSIHQRGDELFAGLINKKAVVQVRVTRVFQDSKLSQILDLVTNAKSKKANTELFISRFAKVYTPIVVGLALALFILPYFWVDAYNWSEWLYKACVFLVISCPCALVISIPLGYFGGIGAASQNGILVKGSQYLDILANIKAFVMDKTGTLTDAKFEVKAIQLQSSYFIDLVLPIVQAIERNSTHPLAQAISNYPSTALKHVDIDKVKEQPGMGLQGVFNGVLWLVGNAKWLESKNIAVPNLQTNATETILHIGEGSHYVGYIALTDVIKADAPVAINALQAQGIFTAILSGDRKEVVKDFATKVGVDKAFGGLLPEEKVTHLTQIKQTYGNVAFVGDGINDAPVLAMSDVGIAMGGLGSDAAIETADVVIQNDQPLKWPLAILIGQKTRQIVRQNIIGAFGVKACFLLLGALGYATMWEAVFADVGVALLAILNAMRLQHIFKIKTKII